MYIPQNEPGESQQKVEIPWLSTRGCSARVNHAGCFLEILVYNEIMFQRASRPSSRGTRNDKRTMY
jgi:hypothetical protein